MEISFLHDMVYEKVAAKTYDKVRNEVMSRVGEELDAKKEELMNLLGEKYAEKLKRYLHSYYLAEEEISFFFAKELIVFSICLGIELQEGFLNLSNG